MRILVWCESLCFPQIHIKILTSKVMALGGGAFGKCLGHDGGALTSGISVPIKEASGRPLPLPLGEDTVRSF